MSLWQKVLVLNEVEYRKLNIAYVPDNAFVLDRRMIMSAAVLYRAVAQLHALRMWQRISSMIASLYISSSGTAVASERPQFRHGARVYGFASPYLHGSSR
jgi:hypothetical protein